MPTCQHDNQNTTFMQKDTKSRWFEEFSHQVFDTPFSRSLYQDISRKIAITTHYNLGGGKVRSKKKTILFGNFSQHGGGGLPKSQNFCKFTKYFFVCQIHSEVLKHVLQMGG